MKFSDQLLKQVERFFARMERDNAFFAKIDAGTLSVDDVASLMANSHYLFKHAQPHLERAVREAKAKHPDMPELAAYFHGHADEEVDHHLWAEDDLAVLDRTKVLAAPDMGTLHKMRELVSYIEASIAEDVMLYPPYILYTEYLGVISVPKTAQRIRENCGIPESALSAFTKHATLDVEHSHEDADIIDHVVGLFPEYKPRFVEVIERASRIYFEFLEEVVASDRVAKATRVA